MKKILALLLALSLLFSFALAEGITLPEAITADEYKANYDAFAALMLPNAAYEWTSQPMDGTGGENPLMHSAVLVEGMPPLVNIAEEDGRLQVISAPYFGLQSDGVTSFLSVSVFCVASLLMSTGMDPLDAMNQATTDVAQALMDQLEGKADNKLYGQTVLFNIVPLEEDSTYTNYTFIMVLE